MKKHTELLFKITHYNNNPYSLMHTVPHSSIELNYIDQIIDLALEEDLGLGDISTSVLNVPQATAQAELTAKEDGFISGISVAQLVASKVDPEVQFEALVTDGSSISKGDLLIRLKGKATSLLGMERTMLNFLQRMSGIATTTAQYVQAVGPHKTVIVDTRKTAPGMRYIDKMAVRHGGGTNHRVDLSSMVMLKDNHVRLIQESGKSFEQIIEQARRSLPLSTRIEVETTNLKEVERALKAGVDVIMLDNMTLEEMKQAVNLIDGECMVEASGNMTLDRIPQVAAIGVDYISVGALTHSIKAFDISMNFI